MLIGTTPQRITAMRLPSFRSRPNGIAIDEEFYVSCSPFGDTKFAVTMSAAAGKKFLFGADGLEYYGFRKIWTHEDGSWIGARAFDQEAKWPDAKFWDAIATLANGVSFVTWTEHGTPHRIVFDGKGGWNQTL